MLHASSHSSRASRWLIALLALSSLIALAVPASALPRGSKFGPMADAPAGYDSQDTCSPNPKPGVVAFSNMLMNAFPQTGSYGISRSCDVGGTSEHKEGRAFDWRANAGVKSERKAAETALDWLLAEDKYGNDFAMARRFGIMYIVWNRRIWGTWGGWSVYCKQKAIGCVKPGTKEVRHPHTDHVHFSFSWNGAKKRTTGWRADRSLVAAIGSPSSYNGYVVAGRNGGIAPFGVPYLGSKSDKYMPRPAVDVTATPYGDGYWLLFGNGQVSAFGEARYKGGAKNKPAGNFVAMATLPDGRGYWIVNKTGRVFAFGRADHFGGLAEEEVHISGIAATPTGAGYWLFGESGRSYPFGDAQSLGDGVADEVSGRVVSAAAHGSLGYWLVTATGRVFAIGDAPDHGGVTDKTFKGEVVGIDAAPDGDGYWIVTSHGRVYARGSAASMGSLSGSALSPQTMDSRPERPETLPLGDPPID